jgi:ABC-type transporter Mla subunit MlaD
MSEVFLKISEWLSNHLNYCLNYCMPILAVIITLFLWSRRKSQNGRDLLSYIPNVWTSLGILFTFIAIVGSLSKIDKNIDIIDLVKNIIPAFITSIIGIIGAICSSILIKIFTKEDEDYDLISNLNTIFTTMSDSIKKQTEVFGKEQYEKTSAITTALLSQFVHTQTNLINNFTEHSKILLENNNAKFEQVSTGLNEKVTEMKREMSDNITALSTSVTDHFNSLLQRLQGTCSDFQGSLKEFSDDLKKNYGFIDDKAGQIVKNYEQSAEAYKDAVQNAHDTNKQASKLLESVQEYMENCNKTNQKVIYTLNVLDERQENINNLVARIQEMSTAIETLQNIENQLNRLNQ